MTEGTHGDVKISGDGVLPAGDYGNVKISGSARLLGNVTASGLEVSGSATGDGKVEAGRAKISGSLEAHSSMSADVLTVSGSADFGGDVKAGDLRVSGRFRAGGDLSAKTMGLRGSAAIAGNLEAEALTGEAQLKVGGLLNAERLDLRVHGGSSAREVGGRFVRIRLPRLARLLPAAVSEPRFETDSIEADEVELEGVAARVVRGDRVRIGKGCVIDLVEYGSEIERDGDTRIKEVRQAHTD
jgi:cytoskeletal protein CcmA (bactofilin family)